MNVETRSQDEIWSPSQSNVRRVAEIASESLVLVAERMLTNVAIEDVGRLLGRVKAVEDEIKQFVYTANSERLIELESQLQAVCESGHKSEAVLIEAKEAELRVRNEDAQRINSHNAATRKLANATNAPLPNFYNNADVETKLQRIADASEEVKRAESELAQHPNAVPDAVQRVRGAEHTLNELIAREKVLRKEIAALCGEPVESTNGNATSRFNGLAR